MSLRSQFATDLKKENDGVDVIVGYNEDDNTPITFVVARQGKSNKEYQKALDAAMKPYRRQLETRTMNEVQAENILRKLFCGYVIKGFKNVRDEKTNKEITYSAEVAEDLMVELPDLYQELQNQASSAALFRIETLEADAKN